MDLKWCLGVSALLSCLIVHVDSVAQVRQQRSLAGTEDMLHSLPGCDEHGWIHSGAGRQTPLESDARSIHRQGTSDADFSRPHVGVIFARMLQIRRRFVDSTVGAASKDMVAICYSCARRTCFAMGITLSGTGCCRWC